MPEPHHDTRVLHSVQDIRPADWDDLLAEQATPSPFMRHAYLAAMESSGSATPDTGWTPRLLTLWTGERLDGACALHVKTHSYGEYVFDWAWADAYRRNGLDYYPKAVIAPPFTPVPGARLLARDTATRVALARAAIGWSSAQGLSSLHVLFAAEADLAACQAAGMMQRHTVQFHWHNTHPATGRPFQDMDDFLASLSQAKRKKIRQERRKVQDAGVRFRWARGAAITPADWRFFYRCYERTYLEHGNAPYLTPAFFDAMARDMPENWLMSIAEHGQQPIAASLFGLDATGRTVYGRYWGALARVDCLHFEACYYQAIEWSIAHGCERFEGGAQGEHKMARALMPVRTSSAHWLAHPAFADAVDRFLAEEGRGVDAYLDHLAERQPFRQAP